MRKLFKNEVKIFKSFFGDSVILLSLQKWKRTFHVAIYFCKKFPKHRPRNAASNDSWWETLAASMNAAFRLIITGGSKRKVPDDQKNTNLAVYNRICRRVYDNILNLGRVPR